jgi:glycosyltransferase involved in cell wall biosynthesis
MKGIKEVIVFSEQGDPRKLKTWSNVPYFLVTTIEKKDIVVNTINLGVTSKFEKKFAKIWNLFFIKILKNTFYTYNRSFIYLFLVEARIKKAVKKYPNSDAFIFTTFSMSASKVSEKPSILFCDWTIDHYVNYFLDKKPDYFQRLAIERQNKIIESANAVFVLFPLIASKMKTYYKNHKIYYIGNVVNNLHDSSIDLVDKKLLTNNILFVGSEKYIKGALELINAYSLLKEKYPTLQLHLVGINENYIPNLPAGVYCYGYLDKAIESQSKIYYDLIRSSKVFINTTPKWAAFSASLEAMYFYTPVIVPSYDEFTTTFGKDINFGYFYNSVKDQLSILIEKVLIEDNFRQLSLNANSAVKEFTWNNYVDKILSQINANDL